MLRRFFMSFDSFFFSFVLIRVVIEHRISQPPQFYSVNDNVFVFDQ